MNGNLEPRPCPAGPSGTAGGPLPGERAGFSSRQVLGVRVDSADFERAVNAILDRAVEGRSGFVCLATVHMLMEAHDSPGFARVLDEAALALPDGMPLVWALRSLGVERACRIAGPDLMPRLCQEAAARGVPIGLYGGRPEVLRELSHRLPESYPGLKLAFAESPPQLPVEAREDPAVIEALRASGARLLFVGLGCPKQERWMAAHASRLPLVQLGVGAAFDFLSGRLSRPPQLVQDAGMEWMHRLWCEPGRLWKRYLYQNPRFLALLAAQLAQRP